MKVDLHTALCGDALEEVLGNGLIFALEWFDEDDAKIRLRLLCIETLDTEHFGSMARLRHSPPSSDMSTFRVVL